MVDPVYSVARPTYPVSFTGAIQPGGWGQGAGTSIVIPRLHRREGDTEDNRVASYQLTLQATFLLGQEVFIYDSIGSTPGYYIGTHNYQFPHMFTFDNDLRMACSSYATTYYVLARYYLPTRA